jgi:hypothetical protein
MLLNYMQKVLRKADIRDLWKAGEIVCVTTNGYVHKDGRGVMGRGNAKAMADMISELPYRLGLHINTYGNVVGFIYDRVIAYPVKPIMTSDITLVMDRVKHLYRNKNFIPGYHCKASLITILNSALQLVTLVDTRKLPKVYLPVPGIGFGEIDKTSKLFIDIL